MRIQRCVLRFVVVLRRHVLPGRTVLRSDGLHRLPDRGSTWMRGEVRRLLERSLELWWLRNRVWRWTRVLFRDLHSTQHPSQLRELRQDMRGRPCLLQRYQDLHELPGVRRAVHERRRLLHGLGLPVAQLAVLWIAAQVRRRLEHQLWRNRRHAALPVETN